MAFDDNRVEFRVTDTQRFIARAALAASGADERLDDPKLIDGMIRAMLVIEQGHMQAYMLRGFNWSHRSRFWQDPEKARRERAEFLECVEGFHQYIDQVPCEAARRIRGNRKRRIKEMVQEAQHLQQYAGQQLRDLEQRRRGEFNPDAANWDEAPRQLHLGQPGEDAA
jgi:hypothetical protein